MNLQAVGNLAFTVGDSPVSQSLSCVATYGAQTVGTIDVPSGTASGVPFNVPFGSISAAKGYFLKAGCDVRVAVNGATGSPQSIASGGFMMGAAPAVVSGAPVTSITLVTVASADGLKQITFGVYGD